jgi:cbb3-type cytochrome oxidase maturation protein
MTALAWLIPAALFLGGLGLVAFLWALRSGQFEDLEGAAYRSRTNRRMIRRLRWRPSELRLDSGLRGMASSTASYFRFVMIASEESDIFFGMFDIVCVNFAMGSMSI